MTVKLAAEQEEFIRRKVRDGAFATTDAAISEAVKLLEEQDRWREAAAEKIEQGWSEASSGLLLREEDVIREMANRKSEWKSKAGR